MIKFLLDVERKATEGTHSKVSDCATLSKAAMSPGWDFAKSRRCGRSSPDRVNTFIIIPVAEGVRHSGSGADIDLSRYRKLSPFDSAGCLERYSHIWHGTGGSRPTPCGSLDPSGGFVGRLLTLDL